MIETQLAPVLVIFGQFTAARFGKTEIVLRKDLTYPGLLQTDMNSMLVREAAKRGAKLLVFRRKGIGNKQERVLKTQVAGLKQLA